MTATDSHTEAAEDLLRTYGIVPLQQMGRQRGVDVRSKGKAALIPLLARKLFDPAAIEASLDNLEPTERATLERLILLGGRAATATLRGELERDGIVDRAPESQHWYRQERGTIRQRGSRKFEDIVARLGVLGLVFTTSTYGGEVQLTTPGPYLFIPAGVMEHLPLVAIAPATAAPPPVERPAAVDSLLRDVYMLLSFARDGAIPLTVRGQIPKRTLVQIDQALRLPEGAAEVKSETELGRLPLLRALAEELFVLVPGANSLQLGDGAEGFLARPRGERRRQLFQAYRETRHWSELTRLRDVSVRPSTALNGPAVVKARQRILAELTELPANRWIPLEHLIDRMRRRAYEFLLPRDYGYKRHYYGSGYNYEPNPYQGDNELRLTFDGISDQRMGWDRVEAVVIRVVVTEALYWLGIVDLGLPAAEGAEPTSFRITPDGATLLGGGTPASPPAAAHVVVQPNFQIFAFDPTGEDVLFTLDRIAKRVRSEQVVEYQLTRESAYGAQRDGFDSDSILAFLERISSTPLPQNVRRSLEDWGAQLERIVLRRSAAALQAADAATLDRLYADPELSKLLGRRLTPTVALVPIDNLPAIQARMAGDGAARGLPLPALSEGDDARDTPAITAEPDGRIAFAHRVPSVYVQRRLRPFSEEEPDGTLQLTRKSLRAGARGHAGFQRLTADEMIAALQTLHRGPLPEEVAAMVRRWAKNWGQGALVEMALLQAESAEILADLLADPELKPYLQPIPGAPTLAAVQREHMEEVRSRLEDRGMDLGNQLIVK